MTRTLDVACPTCGSGPRLPCLTRSGVESSNAHTARVRAGRDLPPLVVDFVAYGNFTDPVRGVNGVVVRYTEASPSPWRQVLVAIKRLVTPWLDRGERKLRFDVDGDHDPETKALWNGSSKFRHYEWRDGALVEVEVGR